MTTLAVQAHPVEDSFSAALLETAVAGIPDVRVIRLGQGDQLRRADFLAVTELLAVYPTWWGSLPAMMMAALHDVIGPWVDGSEPPGSSPLATVRTINVVTTHGSSKLVNLLQGEPGMQLWKRTVLPLCAPQADFIWQAMYMLDRATDAHRAAFLTQISPQHRR